MSRILKGLVTSYRTGPKTQKSKECILLFNQIKSSKEASRLIGLKVAWPVGGRKIRGKILAIHGKGGLVIARFRKGLPGQALMTPVEIIG